MPPWVAKLIWGEAGATQAQPGARSMVSFSETQFSH